MVRGGLTAWNLKERRGVAMWLSEREFQTAGRAGAKARGGEPHGLESKKSEDKREQGGHDRSSER